MQQLKNFIKLCAVVLIFVFETKLYTQNMDLSISSGQKEGWNREFFYLGGLCQEFLFGGEL